MTTTRRTVPQSSPAADAALRDAFGAYFAALDEATIEADGGARQVNGVLYAGRLSRATDSLYNALASVVFRGSLDPALIERAMRATAFPLKLWNELQARNPGANHRRYRDGDLITADDIRVIHAVAKALKINGERIEAKPAAWTWRESVDYLLARPRNKSRSESAVASQLDREAKKHDGMKIGKRFDPAMVKKLGNGKL